MAMQDIVKIHENDNVAVALRPLAKGETLDVAGVKVSLLEDIPQGHKFALRFIKAAEEVVKYGFRIGYAKGVGPCAQCEDCPGRCAYL